MKKLLRARSAVIVLGLPILTVAAHDIGIWLVARLLSGLTQLEGVRHFAVALFRDEVYARLVLGMVGNVDVRGLAVSGPIHFVLDPLARSFLAPPQYLSWFGDWSGVVFTAGSSAVGVHLVQLVANLSMTVFGVAILNALRKRGGRPGMPLLLLGMLWLGYGAGAELELWWGKGSGGEMALSMVATKIAGLSSGAYDLAMRHDRLLSLAINGLLIATAIAVGMLASLPFAPHEARAAARQAAPRVSGSRSRIALSAGILLVVLVYSTVSSAVAFESSGLAVGALPSSQTHLATVVSTWPSVVTITKRADGSGWDYRVNGRSEWIRGMGYNAMTAGKPPPDRALIFDRDFSAIHDMGANTIVGWSEEEFDDLLLQKAAEHGLGVVVPFVLGPMTVNGAPYYDYRDPRVRRQVMDAVTQRVMHFRNSPGLRMWGLGNEVLHAITWAHGSEDELRAFASFLIEAADKVHALDPNHPVVYRDAEDWYAQWVIDALAHDPKPRPWFVYGMNFFQAGIDHALDLGHVASMQQPMLISEFGPVGLRPEARPDGYRALWDIIERRNDHLLGGCVYVWTTAGPEPLDRYFGVTDEDGHATDGTLSELSSLFQS